ncbi:MAG: Tim44 domain-containing protein [Betaproteobacteria bacterium]|nr:MAG: Tim44 domain-containing protein [Betaproteobacteria bacterium]TAG48989.1 MAG: Tim44 domain-containing protein [Betaproteobacteria bacterium]
MLKTLSLIVVSAALALGSAAVDAKKLGGGKSVGAQRDTSAQRQASPAAAPATAAAAAPAAGAAAGAAAKSTPKWLGPVAGIAAALGLGYLMSQMGTAGLIGFLLVGILFLVGMFFLGRMLMKKNAATPNGAPMPFGNDNAQRAEPALRSVESGVAGTAAAAGAPVMAAGLAGGFGIPAGFDKAGFENNAKQQFMALQAANDKGDLDAVRDFSTDEFYNQIAKDVIGGNKEATRVEDLNATLLGIETDRGNYWASVQFTGKMSEDGMMMTSPFTETWNLVKPVDGSKGWLLAGIQQD